MAHPRNTEATFWQKVDRGDPADCWPWTGGRWWFGHGRTSVGGVPWRAHRLAWLYTNGRLPRGLDVCHRCDNPPCCNPAHLFLGDQAANNADCRAKGRARWLTGEACPSARLTAAEVQTIRSRYAAGGVSQRAIAAEFGISQASVSMIVTRQRWAA